MLRLQIVTWSITAAMSGVLYWIMWPLVPRARLWMAAGISLAFLLGSAAMVAIRRAGLDPARDRPSYWHRHTVLVSWMMNAAATAVFWLVMPYASTATLLFTILLVVTMAMVQSAATIRSPASGPPSRWARWVSLPLPLMVIVYLVVNPGPLALPLIAFLAAMMPLNILLRSNMQRTLTRLHDARCEADAAKEARTRFLAAASHDLRQPLQSARLFVGQARRAAATPDRERALRNAATALDAIDRLAQQSLDHLRTDEATVRPRNLAAGSVIARIRFQFEPVAAVQRVEIRSVPARLTVLADRDLLERALGNLVDNALRHARPRRILIGVRRYGDRVRFYVIDDGRGIHVEQKDLLFEPFVQGERAGAGERGGFGLGLANVRRSAEAMGGAAGIDPRWRSGAAFFIQVPRGGAENTAA